MASRLRRRSAAVAAEHYIILLRCCRAQLCLGDETGSSCFEPDLIGSSKSRRYRSTSYQPHDQGDKKDDEKDEEQDLGNTRSTRRNSAKAEGSGNDRNDEKNQSVVEHDLTSVTVSWSRARSARIAS
jgi:hypothetical protein